MARSTVSDGMIRVDETERQFRYWWNFSRGFDVPVTSQAMARYRNMAALVWTAELVRLRKAVE